MFVAVMALWRRLCLVLWIWLAIIATVILSVLDYETIHQAFWEVDDDAELRGAQKLRLKLRAEEKSHEVSGTKLHMVAHGGAWWRMVVVVVARKARFSVATSRVLETVPPPNSLPLPHHPTPPPHYLTSCGPHRSRTYAREPSLVKLRRSLSRSWVSRPWAGSSRSARTGPPPPPPPPLTTTHHHPPPLRHPTSHHRPAAPPPTTTSPPRHLATLASEATWAPGPPPPPTCVPSRA